MNKDITNKYADQQKKLYTCKYTDFLKKLCFLLFPRVNILTYKRKFIFPF